MAPFFPPSVRSHRRRGRRADRIQANPKARRVPLSWFRPTSVCACDPHPSPLSLCSVRDTALRFSVLVVTWSLSFRWLFFQFLGVPSCVCARIESLVSSDTSNLIPVYAWCCVLCMRSDIDLLRPTMSGQPPFKSNLSSILSPIKGGDGAAQPVGPKTPTAAMTAPKLTASASSSKDARDPFMSSKTVSALSQSLPVLSKFELYVRNPLWTSELLRRPALFVGQSGARYFLLFF